MNENIYVALMRKLQVHCRDYNVTFLLIISAGGNMTNYFGTMLDKLRFTKLRRIRLTRRQQLLVMKGTIKYIKHSRNPLHDIHMQPQPSLFA